MSEIDFKGNDLLALYQVAANEIREHKNRQIVYTNYGILLQGVIIWLFQFSEKLLNNFPLVVVTIILLIASFIVAFIGHRCINSFQESMREKRGILKCLYGKFSGNFKSCLGEIPENYTSKEFYHNLFAKPLIFIFWLSFFAVFYITILSLKPKFMP